MSTKWFIWMNRLRPHSTCHNISCMQEANLYCIQLWWHKCHLLYSTKWKKKLNKWIHQVCKCDNQKNVRRKTSSHANEWMAMEYRSSASVLVSIRRISINHTRTCITTARQTHKRNNIIISDEFARRRNEPQQQQREIKKKEQRLEQNWNFRHK